MTVLEDLLGEVFLDVYVNDSEDELCFVNENLKVTFLHYQDCCEDVHIEDIVGDLQDLIGQPILLAEVVSNYEDENQYNDAQQWTFYKFATRKGYVDVRWFGSSNGYYSTDVSMKVEKF